MSTEFLEKYLPRLGRATGGGVMALITIASIVSLSPTIAVNGAGTALLSFLAGLLGDVVAGPAINRLMSGKIREGDIELLLHALTEEFEALHLETKLKEQQKLNQEILNDIRLVMQQQNTFVQAIGVALQHHEITIVEKILGALARFQPIDPSAVIEQIASRNSIEIKKLDNETQYLIDLIANLRNRLHTWHDYIDLSVQADIEPSLVPIAADPSKSTTMYLLMSDSGLTPESEDKNKSQSPQERSKHRLSSISEAISDHPRFVLTGEPGAGKTTTIEHLALQQALERLAYKAERRAKSKPVIPMIVYLPDWAQDNRSILELIERKWRLVTDPVGMLQRGEMTLYLDGLNELGEMGPEKARQLYHWLNSERTARSVIITCRKHDYVDKLDLDLPIVVIESMDDSQIENFVKKYIPKQAARFMATIKNLPEKENQKNRSLYRLAKNPFLLSAMIFLFAQGEEGLPQNRGALFHHLLFASWKREQWRRTTGWINFEDMRRQYGLLAFAMVKEGRATSVPLKYAQQYVKQDSLLKVGMRAKYIEYDERNLNFQHQLIQEYFAAAQLKNISLRTVIKPPKFSKFSGQRVAGDWDEVVSAMCGIVQPSQLEHILTELIEIDSWLVTRIWGEGIEIPPHLMDRTKQRLIRNLSHRNAAARNMTVEALGLIGDDSVWNQLLTMLNDVSTRVVRSTLWSLTYINGGRAVPYLELACESDDVLTRQVAKQCLIYLDKPSPNLISSGNDDTTQINRTQPELSVEQLVAEIGAMHKAEKLIEFLSHREEKVRLKAARRIGDKRIQSAYEHILNMTYSYNEKIRMESANTLGKLKIEAAHNRLHEMTYDNAPLVRRIACKALGKLKNPESTNRLIELLYDPHHKVIAAAIKTVASIQLKESIPRLIELTSHRNSEVTRESLNALGRLNAHEASERILEMLRSTVRRSTMERVIWLAGELKIYEAENELVSMLDDNRPKIVAAAINSLAELNVQSVKPYIFTLTNSENSEIRSSARKAIQKYDR